MVTVAVISEYNPFHKGHKYQIDKIREQFGADTAIVSIMSGNFTQRGELAIAPKGIRARCAIDCGVDLVLELPFPYSSSSAELFAKSGVKIADSLGIVDYLSFGSECGDIKKITECADIFDSENFKKALSEISSDRTLGYPEMCELAYKRCNKSECISFTPNNILAIEYVRAIKELKSKIIPHTVKRVGAAYDEDSVISAQFQSASAIRKLIISEERELAMTMIPSSADHIRASFISGDAPTDIERLAPAIISSLRLNSPAPIMDYHDAADGLYNRLRNASFEANDISSLIELSQTKNYTLSRLRRAMLNVFFGVTSSDVKALPSYTQVLGMNKIGMLLLKNAKKCDNFRILTKPSAYEEFGPLAKAQKELSDRADSIFEMAKPSPKDGKCTLRFTPYVKK